MTLEEQAKQQAENAVHQITEHIEKVSKEAYQEGYEQAIVDTAAGSQMYTKGFWAGFTIAAILFLLWTIIHYIL